MNGFRWRARILVFAVALAASFSAAHATKYVYLYDPDVADDVDISAYTTDGTVQKANGGGSFAHYVDKGPAPSSYPTIQMMENSFECLGTSNVQIDGVVFLNHGNYYVPNKKALVLWTVRIIDASQRTQAEFQQDLTLSLWVDWNQDNTWKQSERMIVKSFNVANQFPTTESDIIVEYLTSFRVPDVTSEEFLSMQAKYGNSGKDIRHMWVRTLVAYDDPDVSPDGAQLFGEYEDYLVSYLVQVPYTTR
ncbi:MAG TPA: GEVED domain-containing protein [Candidatus Krumholzibacteria bacterium]|nr:GEVED domain-containing protein [Candidatus Krumholzibacteria bacterium]